MKRPRLPTFPAQATEPNTSPVARIQLSVPGNSISTRTRLPAGSSVSCSKQNPFADTLPARSRLKELPGKRARIVVALRPLLRVGRWCRSAGWNSLPI
jgi:hypothetical protein